MIIAVLPTFSGHTTAASASSGAAPRRSVPERAPVPRPGRVRLLLPRQHPFAAGHLAPALDQAQAAAGTQPPLLGTMLQHLGTF